MALRRLMSAAPRLLLFELYHQGHHGQFVQVALDHWVQHDLPGTLDVVVSREFGDRYATMLDAAQAHPRVHVYPTETPVDLQAKTGRRAVLDNDRRIGRVLRAAVERHRPDHVLLMYADHLQFSLATGLRFGFPVRISGIYFRPSFYYRAAGRGPATVRTRLDDLQKRLLLRGALANPHVHTWFSLDPDAVVPIRALAPRARVVALPEAFDETPAAPERPSLTRQRLGVEDGRAVLLLFGSLDPRKGAGVLIDALARLPDALGRRVCLLVAGEETAGSGLADALGALRARGTVQVVRREGYLPDDALPGLFRAASVVVLPYQNHVGSSGVLIRAAAAGVPVLGPRYGMIGARIDQHRLGLTADTCDADALAQALARVLDPAGRGALDGAFDADAARALAAANTNAAFASTLFQHVLTPEDEPGGRR